MWENYRDDGRDLLAEWANNTDHGTRKYIATKAEEKGKPTIAEMATSAVSFLKAKAGPEGFFIMIEGGRIDAAHHNGQAVRALSETLAFDKAIEEVLKLVDLEETLVLVTADHAHTMSIGGYTNRELDITGSMYGDDGGEEAINMSILSYGNGPGFRNLMTDGEGNYTHIDRSNVTLGVNASAELRFRQPSATPLKSETHGGMMLASGQPGL